MHSPCTLEGSGMALEETSTVMCNRCETRINEAEAMEVHAWWLCGNCYDEI
jgi:hypothetical protein